MTLDEAVTLAEAYLDAEHAATAAVFTAPDDAAVARSVEALRALTLPTADAPLGASTPGRRPGMSAAEVAGDNALLDHYRRRTLFQVAHHAHPLWGDLFAAYAGAVSEVAAGSYARLLYLAGTEQGPRVVAEYDAEPMSERVEWHHVGGVVVDDPGPVVETRRLAEPVDPRDREHWRSVGAP